jgi:hypothetical protein
MNWARLIRCLRYLALALVSTPALAAPVATTWTVAGPDDTAAVAVAALSGWYAAADSFEDHVEIRDRAQNLLATITKSQIQTLLPWMSLDGGPDGVSAMAFTDSGRLLFLAVHDDTVAPDAQPSDAILRYDTFLGTLNVFTRFEIASFGNAWLHGAMVHFRGRLYAGVTSDLRVYQAGQNDLTGVLLTTFVGAGPRITGLAIDRANSTLYESAGNSIFRATIGTGTSLTFTAVGSVTGLRSLAWSDNFGGLTQSGLYALTSGGGGPSTLWFITPAMARGQAGFVPSSYLTPGEEWHDLASTPDGRLLGGRDEDAAMVHDTTDTRLAYDAWVLDEFRQHVALARGLITAGPEGWVIDADVQTGGTRFHPATPDAAGWTVLLLLLSDHIEGDPSAEADVARVLRRYAGRAADGIAPSRTADGIYRHWIEPATGGVKSGWDPEFATLSTMKIVMAASRAAAFYPGNADIQASVREIICGVSNWDAYFVPSSSAMYFKGLLTGGPDTSVASSPFHEGIIWASQASAYGTSVSQTKYANWLNRGLWPLATTLNGFPVTGNVSGGTQAAFLSLYPLMVLEDYRASPTWRAQVDSLRLSNAGWTDDNGPKYSTVFSAGTTASQWGGYNADSLGFHPGNVTTFPSLLAFCAGNGGTPGRTHEAVAGYHAYRLGARQTFLGGASILYRRSDVDRAYTPNSAGLPDTALGGLGLAELLSPGSVGQILAGPWASCACVADVDDGSGTGTPDGGVTVDDLLYYLVLFENGDSRADVDDGSGTGTPDAGVTIDDLLYFLVRFEAGC